MASDVELRALAGRVASRFHYGAAMFIRALEAPQARLFASRTRMRFEFRNGRFESVTATPVNTAMCSRASRGCPASIAACAPRREWRSIVIDVRLVASASTSARRAAIVALDEWQRRGGVGGPCRVE